MDDAWAREWIEDYGAAWRGADADTVAELFGEDAVYRSSPLRAPSVGGRPSAATGAKRRRRSATST